jgi:hypothetical protein
MVFGSRYFVPVNYLLVSTELHSLMRNELDAVPYKVIRKYVHNSLRDFPLDRIVHNYLCIGN